MFFIPFFFCTFCVKVSPQVRQTNMTFHSNRFTNIWTFSRHFSSKNWFSIVFCWFCA